MYWHRTHKTSLRVKNTIRELMPCTVGAWWCGWGDHGWLGVGLIKCCDCQRSLLARSISDPSVLATRGTYVVILSLCCVLSVCNVFTTPRAGHQSRPLPLVLYCFSSLIGSNAVCGSFKTVAKIYICVYAVCCDGSSLYKNKFLKTNLDIFHEPNLY